jgi:hypothetical protein
MAAYPMPTPAEATHHATQLPGSGHQDERHEVPEPEHGGAHHQRPLGTGAAERDADRDEPHREPLQGASDQRRHERVGERADHGADQQDAGAGDQHPLLAEQVGDPAGHRHRDRGGQQRDRDDPRRVARRRAEQPWQLALDRDDQRLGEGGGC